MNHNPWYVDNTASYERQRIRDDMRQIRLEQKALKARVRAEKPAGWQPAALGTLRRATLAVTEAVMSILA
jgi:hypothetical protein